MFVTADITGETVASVARQLSGAAGHGGTDSVSLQHWLLQFGTESTGLRKIVRDFGDWMANVPPTCVDYRALMLGCLIGLNQCPGVRPVGVGETWQRILAKCML